MVQFNRISRQGIFKPIESFLIEFSEIVINNLLFEQLLIVLEDSANILPESIIQNNMFEKV